MTYSATAIVLKREAWRDSARTYSFYTREHGKVLAVGRGTRKVLSKLAAHLEPFSSVELLLARGRRSETVCGAVMSRSPEPLVLDPFRHEAASFVVELFDQLVRPGERDDRLWRALDGTLSELASLPEAGVPGALAGFAWRFMDRLGYRPKLENCAECERALAFEAARLLPRLGAAACLRCLLDERALAGAVPISAEAARMLHEGLDLEDASFPPALLPPALSFVEAHLDRPLATLPIVRARFLAPAFSADAAHGMLVRMNPL